MSYDGKPQPYDARSIDKLRRDKGPRDLPKYDPDAPIPERDIDGVFDVMVTCLNREMELLNRQSMAEYGLAGGRLESLLKLSAAIGSAYRARPGRPFDPLDQRADETIEEWKERLERLK